MLQRYLNPQMEDIWGEETTYQDWLQMELALLEVRMENGDITKVCYNFIRRHAGFTVQEIHEREKVTRHDLVAFVQTLQAHVKIAGLRSGRSQAQMERWAGEIHKGITSYDIEDPATMLRLRATCRLIRGRVDELRLALLARATLVGSSPDSSIGLSPTIASRAVLAVNAFAMPS